jgi:uncharacterized protein YprB with RNaseH-like and TPR domain
MGFNNESGCPLVFDIETAPLAVALEYLEPASAPANYKDPVKIAEYIAAKEAEDLDRCGLDVDLCRIVAIGTQDEQMDAPCVWLAQTEADERDILQRFWHVATDAHLIGFNCLGFDLPVLFRRSLYLGVRTPHIQIDRFKHPGVSDLMQILSFNGLLKLRGLSFYAKRFGIEIEDEITGKEVAEAIKAGDWASVETHASVDVQKTAALAAKLGLFHPQPVVVT